MLPKETERALTEREAVSPRIIRASFRTVKQKVNMSVIQCYAPTNDKDASVKEEFYMQLQNIINNETRGNLKMLMGDLNAKIGSDNTGYEEIMGRHGLGVMNENGELFTHFCAGNQDVMVEVFSLINEYTRQHGNHQTMRQLIKLTTYVLTKSLDHSFTKLGLSEVPMYLLTISWW
ncbi:unnamed protein product [Candidula unifasciata]|uniref:Endonuclease/exonuclease/phosphatase domain-containing protein n=1 Tax=Candidula unifasciata TaxID=100452 RepID=A0A8S3Z4A3_9EUPU|nr:unnamed protein product [Candidula unifasciata]